MGRPRGIAETDRVYTAEEAAEKARCSTAKVRRAVRNKRLEAMDRPTPKHHLRILRRHLDAWILDGADARPK